MSFLRSFAVVTLISLAVGCSSDDSAVTDDTGTKDLGGGASDAVEAEADPDAESCQPVQFDLALATKHGDAAYCLPGCSRVRINLLDAFVRTERGDTPVTSEELPIRTTAGAALNCEPVDCNGCRLPVCNGCRPPECDSRQCESATATEQSLSVVWSGKWYMGYGYGMAMCGSQFGGEYDCRYGSCAMASQYKARVCAQVGTPAEDSCVPSSTLEACTTVTIDYPAADGIRVQLNEIVGTP